MNEALDEVEPNYNTMNVVMNHIIVMFDLCTVRGKKLKVKQAVLTVLIPFLLTGNMFIWDRMNNLSEYSDFQKIAVNTSTILSVENDNQASLIAMKEMTLPAPLSSEGKTVSMTAYTSRVEETDSSPCISADGTNICKYDGCIVASNDYPFDTLLVVEGFGECVVKDRMSSRYTGTGNMDMYFGKNLKGALRFGRQNLKIRVTS